jgi:hypothetical protein
MILYRLIISLCLYTGHGMKYVLNWIMASCGEEADSKLNVYK